jgi:hypothetical protein
VRKASWLAILLVSFVLPSSAAAIHRSEQYSFQSWVGCANAGKGELIDFAGYFAEVVTINEPTVGGITKINLHQVPFITGRGESTGYTYRVVGSSNSTATFYAAPPNFSISGNAIFNFGIIGGGANLQIHDRLKYSVVEDSITGEQTVTITHDDIMVFCH